MKKIYLVLLAFTLFVFSSCKKNNDEEKPLILKDAINGFVQKGPFLNGTSMGIYELNDTYSPTGKIYTTQIADNSGVFQIDNISLISQYVLLKADGYYFNEITGENSSSPITLYALTDVTNKTSINVNVLSNLEKSRIEYLISNGLSFSIAKKQAELEILKIFSITKPDIVDSDLLNITQDGDDNAILLAISIIMQGYRTESDLSELLANISTDIRQDGLLNSASLGSMLINDAKLLDLPQIRANIENRYANLGMTVTVPNFEKYINRFLDSTNYQFTNNIIYPEFSTYGENILFGDKTTFSSNLSLAANLPKGSSLKIIIKSGRWAYQIGQNGPINWAISTYDNELQQQTFTAIESGRSCDLNFEFIQGSSHIIEYYENNSLIPTRVKTVMSK